MPLDVSPIHFRYNSQHVPPKMIGGVRKATARFVNGRADRAAELDIWEELRQAAHEIRLHTIDHLDYYLERLERSVIAAGGHVHWARDGSEACELVLRIARDRGVKTVVKAKSMASEEVSLNHALQAAGVDALETDLGEYIIQLAGTGPSHIVAPALHLSKEEIAQLFSDKFGIDAPPDPIKLTEIARARLRQAFLSADMGISGANFMVAETGTIVTVTNEGNARMCTTFPPVHVAIAGIDKVIPDWESLTVFLKLLARSATGQKISTYTSFITGPRRHEHENGPREFHLVLLDNGRTKILSAPETRETLKCIRCGACLNICPVYNHVGGHAYGYAYSGPIGSILSPQILGNRIASDLAWASTLCGACADVCPVKIPIPDILLHLRRRFAEGDAVEPPVASGAARGLASVVATMLSTPVVYRIGSRILGVLQAPFRRGDYLPHLPPPVDRWTMSRPFPAFRYGFRDWWTRHRRGVS